MDEWFPRAKCAPCRSKASRRCWNRSAAKSTSRFIVVILAISAAFAVSLSATVKSFHAQTSLQLLLQGRFVVNDEQSLVVALPILLSWPASSVSVTFDSDTISATLSAVKPTVGVSGYNRFSFIIDKNGQDIETQDLNRTVTKWSATGLGAGPHTLTITKLNEAMYGKATLDALAVGAGGKWLAPVLPAVSKPGRRIQFIGDSFATGYGNTGENGSCNLTACTPYTCMPELESEDATLAWGPLAAGNLSADYQLIAWSGSGVVTYFVPEAMAADNPEYAAQPQWIQEAQYPLIPDLFQQQEAGDNGSSIANSSWVPQIVVMAGGANDFMLPAVSLQEWSAPYLDFLQTVADEYASPAIILLTYPLESMWDDSLTPNQTAYYMQYMNSLYVQTQMRGMSNVYLLQLNGKDFPTDNWCAGHPSTAAHLNIASQLSQYIQAVLPDWGTTT